MEIDQHLMKCTVTRGIRALRPEEEVTIYFSSIAIENPPTAVSNARTEATHDHLGASK